MRISSAVRFDILFQFRHGFYYAYAVVSLLYVIVLRILPLQMREYVATGLITSDPAVLGFFFIGGIVLLERGQNTLESLFVTPLQVSEYLISKVASLTVLAVLSSLVITLLSFGLAFQPILFVSGIVLTSAFFTLVGIAIAVRVKSINGFLGASMYLTVFFLPFLEYFQILHSPLFYIFPTKAALLLIGSAFVKITPLEVVYAVLTLLVWAGFAYHLANHWFYQYVILRIGGGK